MSRKHAPTKKTIESVRRMASLGHSEDKIAHAIGITGKTLRKWYREQLDNALLEANTAVGHALYRAAIAGNVRAQEFWLKTRDRDPITKVTRWKETTAHEFTGEDGGAIEVDAEVVVTFDVGSGVSGENSTDLDTPEDD